MLHFGFDHLVSNTLPVAGASVLIFGWIVYLVVRGLLNRRTTEILIGVAVFLLYSGALLAARVLDRPRRTAYDLR